MEPGSQLGSYVIKERVGRGATAEVFRALQPAIDRDVAIKVMFPHLTDSPDFSGRFQREARAMGQLQHPNIGRIIDFDARGERPYMVMEHLEGGTLQQLMASRGQLPIPFAIRLTRQLAAALGYAHNLGMVHRDIKPANVMFTDDTYDSPTLMDFGMARLVDEQMTTTGAILGTPAYMAPEQVRGEVVGPPADMYNLAVMLYQMVTGRPLYEADSVHSLMMKHVDAPVPSARACTPTVSEDLDSFLHTALAKQPADRFGDAGEMVAALDRLLGMSPVPESGVSDVAASQTTERPTRQSTSARPGSRSRAGLIVAVAAVALIAAGTVFALTRGASIPSQEAVVSGQAGDAAEAAQTDAADKNESMSTQVDGDAETEPADVQAAEAEAPTKDSAPTAETSMAVAAQARAGFDAAAPPAFFPTSAQMQGDEFVLSWDRTRPAPALLDATPPLQTEYQLFVDKAVSPLAVDADGRGTLRLAAPAHLARTFTVAVVDPATGDRVGVVHENSMSAADRAAFDERLADSAHIQRELAIAIDHRGFIGDELANGDLGAAYRHTEHVINIVEGADGPLFGDLDSSGLAENPGDGVGILSYAQSWSEVGGDGDRDLQLVDLATADLIASQNAGVRLISSDSINEASAAFDELSRSLLLAAERLDHAQATARNLAVQSLVGAPLHLTGTDTSIGTIAVLPATREVVISTTNPAAEGTIQVQTRTGLTLEIPDRGSVTIATSEGFQFEQFGEVTLIDPNGEPVASGAFDAVALDIYQELTTSDGGVLALLNDQAQIVVDHADLMRQEVETGAHSEVRRHAEHVINVIVGEQGAEFGDIDGDGAAQNPGDGVGALIYLDRVDALLDRLPTITIEQQFFGEAYRSSIGNIRQQLLAAKAEALRVVATDSANEAEPPMVEVITSAVAVLDGIDVDRSGSIDVDEAGVRGLPDLAASLLSSPLEP